MYQKEEWTELLYPNTAGRYEVSSYGRVWDTNRGCFVAPVLSGEPAYWYVNLTCVEGKKDRILRRVHNLMMKSFKPEGEFKGASVDHIDRNRYNNCLWNLRWASRKKQSQNRGVVLVTDEGFILRDRVIVIDKIPEIHYGFFYTYYKDGITSYKELYRMYLAKEKYGAVWKRRHSSGIYLWEWCNKNNLNVLLSITRLNQGWTEEEVIQGYKETTLNSGLEFEGVWFPNDKYFCTTYNIPERRFLRMERDGVSLRQIIDFDLLDRHRFEIDGVSRTKQEHCDFFGVNLDAVNARCWKRGISFEESVKMKPERIVKYLVNGEVTRLKHLYEMFDVNPKSANAYRSKDPSRTVYDVLEHYGVDTSGLTIEPYTK